MFCFPLDKLQFSTGKNVLFYRIKYFFNTEKNDLNTGLPFISIHF